MKNNFIIALLKDLKNRTSYCISPLLSDRVEDCVSVLGIKFRKIISHILRKAYRKFINHKIVIDYSAPLTKSKKGRIFAANHIQKDDIIISLNVADSSGYTLFGGLPIILGTGNGLGLAAYGIILVDRSRKESRKAAYEKMKYIINNGGNVFVYPEGYFNIADDGQADGRHGADDHNSDSWLVQDLNIGIFRLAQETGCEIVPLILHYDSVGEKVCYGHRGNPLSVGKTDDIFEKKNQLLEVMQTAYYNLIEKYSSYDRKVLEENGLSLKQQNNKLIEEILKETYVPHTGYMMDMTQEKHIGKAVNKKHIVTYQQAFAHLETISPSKSNAFLYRK